MRASSHRDVSGQAPVSQAELISSQPCLPARPLGEVAVGWVSCHSSATSPLLGADANCIRPSGTPPPLLSLHQG